MMSREELRGGGAARPRSFVDVFEEAVLQRGERAATKQKRAGSWVDTSWSELARRARDVADGLAALGIARGDRIALIGEPSTEWILADLGIMGAGAITVPVSPAIEAEARRYILAHSGVRCVFCDTSAQVDKVREKMGELPALEGVIRWSGESSDGFEWTLARLEQQGITWRRSDVGAHAARLARLSLEDPATVMYTNSGREGPKGVVLTHGNWVYVAEAIGELRLVSAGDLVLMALPMAHPFAKAIEAVWLRSGATLAFVESIDKLTEDAEEIHPTVMPAIPRLFERACETLLAQGSSQSGVQKWLFKWAMKGVEAHARGSRGRLGAGWVGRRWVFPKLGASLARQFGGRMRLFVSGGGPLPARIAWLFHDVGFEIVEGYGLTETSAGTCVNRPGHVRIGTVGPPVPGTEVRIAADGEVLVRGGGVMKEYYQDPIGTSEAFQDGWFRTGDLGELDSGGYLRILAHE